MKRHLLSLAALFAFSALTVMPVTAQISAAPTSINFQGRLATPSGNPVANGNYSVLFSLYDAPTAGVLKWSQNFPTVAVKNGTFAVKLDTNTANLFNGNLYLEIKVGSDAPLTPRQQLLSVPYAIKANSVADGSLTTGSFASGVLNFSNIAGTVTGSQIANGTITAANLNASLQGTLSLISNTTSPNLVASLTTNAAPDAIALSGNYAYVTDQFGDSFQIIDISNPAAPVLRSSPATGSTPVAIAVSGTRAAVVNYGSNTLQLFDVTSPTAPVLRSTTTVGNGPNGVAINGNFAYVANVFSNTFQVFDITNPAAPLLRSTTPTDAGPVSIGVNGNTVYVLNRFSSDLQIFDVTTPTAPVLRSTIATGSSPYILAVSGTTVYVVNESDNTFQIFNAASPASPVLLSTTATDATPRAVGVNGTSVYVGNFNANTLQVFDASNLAAPILRGSAATENNPYSVVSNGTSIFVAALADSKFQVFQNSSTPTGILVNGSLRVAGQSYFNQTVNVANRLIVGGAATLLGQVGIGTFSPNYTLDVNGDINASGAVRANGVELTSDARYKTHIANLSDPLDNLLNLRGVSYEWNRAAYPDKNFSEKRQFGFIAQELEKIFPELVTTNADGYKSVNYLGVVPLLVEAVKVQQKQLHAKDSKIADLEAKIDALTKRFDAMELRNK